MNPTLAIIKSRGPNTVGIVLERTDEGNYKVQLGNELLEVPPTDLQIVSMSQARGMRDQLKQKILNLIPSVTPIIKACPDSIQKLTAYLNGQSY